MKKLFFYLESIYRMTNIPVRCFDSSGEVTLFSQGYAASEDPVQHFPLKKMLLALVENTDAPQVEVEDDIVAFGIVRDMLDSIVIIGPAALIRMSKDETLRYGKSHGVESDNFHIIGRTVREVGAAVSMLYTIRTGKILQEKDFHKQGEAKDAGRRSVEGEYQAYIMTNTEHDITRFGYEEERLYLQRIREGVTAETANPLFPQVSETPIGKLAEKPLKHFEYMVCSSITLAARAAMEGGLKPSTAYAMSDLYLQRLEKCNNIKDMFSTHFDAQADYSKQVRLAKESRSKSSYVEKCKSYISQHLNKPFTLDEIADSIGINKSHLCRLFIQEAGMTVMQYTRSKRIEAAKNMLKYSEEGISTIASYLCFPSQSHFGKVFKDITNMTPQAYRDSEQY